ncbi:uncharacterized protein LOC135199203 [Macrobrachium nipponense]|uniref:uncharacterized protein LOC135199203 n=1 Tax=Macrobrachium nipponense TaxID=159736 RepID=UPI0030C88848
MSAVFASTTFQRITGKLWIVGSASVSPNIFQSRWKSTDNIKWLWRASDGTKEVHRANDKGYGVGGYSVTFNSTKPLSPDLFREAVEHLHRKIPWLGVCLLPYKGELWYCQPPNLELNFQASRINSFICPSSNNLYIFLLSYSSSNLENCNVLGSRRWQCG